MFLSDYTPYVLIVEDEEDNRELLSVILSEEGYQVQTAQDGLAAISMVEQIKPDLILMDVNMPRMGGFEACRELKKRHPDIDIPIVFLTGQNSMESIVHGFELGARYYLTKPFNPDELLARVRTHVQMELAQQKLTDLADKLAKYLSPQVYASIFKGEKDARIESYEKKLTVCFTDIVNFTPTVEKMAPVELTNWLNHYLNEMSRIVIKYGGTLDKYIGDAVMIFFGDPTSRGPHRRCDPMRQDGAGDDFSHQNHGGRYSHQHRRMHCRQLRQLRPYGLYHHRQRGQCRLPPRRARSAGSYPYF